MQQTERIAHHVRSVGPCDLMVVVFNALHRGGHYLWDLSQVRDPIPDAFGVRDLGGALAELYEACDRSLGHLIQTASAETRILVFALHGMGPNPAWPERTDSLYAYLTGATRGSASRPSLLGRLRAVIPRPVLRGLERALPDRAIAAMVHAWTSRMYDWRTTRWFPLPIEDAIALRVNTVGRERLGIVPPGDEYRRVIEEIRTLVLGLRDIDTNEPVFERVWEREDFVDADATHADLMPDVIVQWRAGANACRGVRSPHAGDLVWPDGARLPSGRSGDHRSDGWFVAAGPDIAPLPDAGTAAITDPAPTICAWLGDDGDPSMRGVAIPSLVDAACR